MFPTSPITMRMEETGQISTSKDKAEIRKRIPHHRASKPQRSSAPILLQSAETDTQNRAVCCASTEIFLAARKQAGQRNRTKISILIRVFLLRERSFLRTRKKVVSHKRIVAIRSRDASLSRATRPVSLVMENKKKGSPGQVCT
jgi:hypothetical protein